MIRKLKERAPDIGQHAEITLIFDGVDGAAGCNDERKGYICSSHIKADEMNHH